MRTSNELDTQSGAAAESHALQKCEDSSNQLARVEESPLVAHRDEPSTTPLEPTGGPRQSGSDLHAEGIDINQRAFAKIDVAVEVHCGAPEIQVGTRLEGHFSASVVSKSEVQVRTQLDFTSTEKTLPVEPAGAFRRLVDSVVEMDDSPSRLHRFKGVVYDAILFLTTAFFAIDMVSRDMQRLFPLLSTRPLAVLLASGSLLTLVIRYLLRRGSQL